MPEAYGRHVHPACSWQYPVPVRTAALVALCLVVIPAGVFLWATTGRHEPQTLGISTLTQGSHLPKKQLATVQADLLNVLGALHRRPWVCDGQLMKSGTATYQCQAGGATINIRITAKSGNCASIQTNGTSTWRLVCSAGVLDGLQSHT